jgi:CheY-like chemotaxis protein
MVIPLRTALFDRASGQHVGEQLLVLTAPEQTFTFSGFAQPPVLSINRGFSAPVAIDMAVSTDDLVFLAARDDDPFARYEAMQQLVVQHLVAAVTDKLSDEQREAGLAAIGAVYAAVLADAALDDLMRAMWTRYGRPGGARPGEVDTPYTAADVRDRLAEVASDPAWAADVMRRHVDGHEVMDAVQRQPYDIILMDLQMPEMNGFETTEFIRNKMKSKIPIIALSADVTTVDIDTCLAIGMNDYISKPIDEKLLYTKIMKCLKKTE